MTCSPDEPDSLDSETLYEECPICAGTGEEDGRRCLWCGRTGLVEHSCHEAQAGL